MNGRTAKVPRIEVLDLELSHEIEPLRDLEGHDAVRALVRVNGTPIGTVDIAVTGGGCTREAVRDAVLGQLEEPLRAHLHGAGVSLSREALRERPLHESMPSRGPPVAMPLPSITVAICTRNRNEDLAQCLAAVTALDYPDLEVLVIDNAPSGDATERLIATRYPTARYVREPCPGLDRARNRALAEAGGDVIAFTDDDVRVDPDWARVIGATFATAAADVMAVTGAVAPLELETPAQVHFERYGGFGAGFERMELRGGRDWGVRGVWHLADMAQSYTGANMSFRRAVFADTAPFDPALDVGTPTNGGGDIDMLYRVLACGFAIIYEPRALVWHRHRREYGALVRQISGWGTGYTAFLTRSALARPAAAWVFALLGFRGFLRQMRRLAASFIRPPGFPRRLLLTEAVGILAGPLCYWRSKRRSRRLEQSIIDGAERAATP